MAVKARVSPTGLLAAATLLARPAAGSGFVSSDYYLHGFFSASIKLPRGYTAGVVVAFYVSVPSQSMPQRYCRWGGQWRVQTNVYGNGSTSHGREERYLLPFDPTLEAHSYSILWAPTHIIFYVDDTPIREVVRHPDMGGDFPAKPMAVYATIWDGSAWATDGGKYKVNYKHAPFASDFSGLVIVGSRADDPVLRDQEDLLGLVTADYYAAVMTPRERAAMRAFRARRMTYTVCYDAVRYADGPFPECDNSDEERESFSAWGESKTVVVRPRARGRRPRGRKVGAGARRHGTFYVDDTPIREVVRHPDMGGDFPAKPMAVYATIWDGSAWATDGGKYKVNYKHAPFASDFSGLVIVGSRADDPVLRDQEDLLGLVTADYYAAVMTPRERAAMRAFRARRMTYTVCYDAVRYADGPFPECDNSDEERESFSAWGESKTVVVRPRARGRRPRGRKVGAGARRHGTC
ncbi:putative xyloglucan endotransglucosylase/hydrolase protein 30 [Zea mays]|uniref:xyloglucan:xyloglucosyl transferase n=1 Tax=Zea mays TaxID=4577 RepID=A0A1D6Q7L1_MAIZE|nr:putative xyloglucan endotransglucosylase/hydrolase protein 30 [Zea mays]